MYIFYNANPQKLRLQDCVCRAISLATGYSYYDVEETLNTIADIYECEELCVCCYSHLLTDLLKYECFDGLGRTVEQVIKDFPNDILLLRCEGHLTCGVYNYLYDTWNSSQEKVDRFWIVKFDNHN